MRTILSQSRKSIRAAGYLAAGLLAAACSDEPTGAKAFEMSAVASDAANLEQAAATALSAGNFSGAALLTNGATALRAGIEPSEIMVSVGGETTRYHALVIGVVETLAPGDTALRRSLVAWAGDSRTIATLDVSTLGNVGSFSSEFEPASDPRARAQGTWVDLVRDSRWQATTGTAQISVNGIRSDCNTDRFGDVRCVVATYDVFVDGLFRLYGASPDAGLPAVRIQTDARSVMGVIISDGEGRDHRRTPTRGPTTTREAERKQSTGRNEAR